MTVDAKKLDVAMRRFPLSGIPTAGPVHVLVHAVAGADPGRLDAQKAAFVGAGLVRLQELAPADAAALVGELVGLVARGKIPSASIRGEIRGHAGLTPDTANAAKAALADAVREESTVLSPDWVIARGEQSGLDLFAFLDFNRLHLGECTTAAGALGVCLSSLPGAVPGLAREAFTPAFVEKAIDLTAGQEAPGAIVATAKALRDFGVDVKPVVDRMCAAADAADTASNTSAKASQMERDRNRDRGEALLQAAKSLDAGAACLVDVRSKMKWRAVTATGQTGLRFLFLLVPVAAAVIYLRSRWTPVRVKLEAAGREIGEARVAGGGERRIPGAVWSRATATGLADVAQALEGEPSDDLRAAAGLLREIPAEARAEILKKARSAANETMRTGDVTSVLVKVPRAAAATGLAVYVVCFAGRAEQPQAVRRHEAFRDGWEVHAARVREALHAADPASPAPPLLGLLFFLHADAVTGTMLVALEGDGVSVVPERLLGEREARARPGRVNRHHQELDLAGGPAALPAGSPETEEAADDGGSASKQRAA